MIAAAIYGKIVMDLSCCSIEQCIKLLEGLLRVRLIFRISTTS